MVLGKYLQQTRVIDILSLKLQSILYSASNVTTYHQKVMNRNLPVFICSSYLSIVSSQLRGEEKGEKTQIGCQQKSTLGRSYVGEANTTVDGIPCQRWSVTGLSHVGDHNFCRNPDGIAASQVWCYIADPIVLFQYCSVPFCPPLKALDFSLDNDWKADENNSYTHASLQKENLPSSFTICTAFMVEWWTRYTNVMLFVLQDDLGETWHWVEIGALVT